jgi:hypothetical protein
MPYDDITALIASLRYNQAQAVYHRDAEDRASIGSTRKYHREEAMIAAGRVSDIVTTLNANMSTGIDPDDWQNRAAQIEAFLGMERAA